jgi:hypothetical protein
MSLPESALVFFPLRAMFLRITARALQPAPFRKFEAFKTS